MDKRNRKYILLGLGIGIILTNIIYYYNPRIEMEKLDDSEVIERARELGMVTMKESIKTEGSEKINLEPVQGVESMEDDIIEDAQTEDANVESPKESNTKVEDKKNIVFKINSGEGLGEISRELKESGIIEDVEAFKDRVYERKVSKKLQPGEFELNKDMTFDEIIDNIIKSKG